MAIRDADLWHQVHAQREDGVPATFLIREVDPRPDQPQIFVVEMPYPATEPSKLPDAEDYQRLDTFQEQWVEPACEALGWTLVAWKSEDGSFFLYLYGNGDPNALFEKLSPFDGALGFFHDRDADWSEYAALRELVEQAQAAHNLSGEHDHSHDDDAHDHDHTHDHHDHDHDHTHDHHDHDHASNGIVVIDRTGDRPAAKPKAAKPKAAKPARASATAAKPKAAKPRASATAAKPPATKPAKARAAKAAPARPATKSRTTKAAQTRPAKAKATAPKRAASKPAKPAAKKPTPAKTAARQPARSQRPAPRTSRR